jgi:hypothetical protein
VVERHVANVNVVGSTPIARSNKRLAMTDYLLNNFNPNDETFKSAFWDWFDNLSKTEKKKFWDFSVDMAMIYFYNKIYRHKK